MPTARGDERKGAGVLGESAASINKSPRSLRVEGFSREESSQRAPPFFVDGGSINQTRLEPHKNRFMIKWRMALRSKIQVNSVYVFQLSLVPPAPVLRGRGQNTQIDAASHGEHGSLV